ncbi:MAG: hypothetical protein ABJB97_02240, partial [Acidobacteriota bacterium]
AMRRANGDWYAMDDQGSSRVPVFESVRDAMIARSRDPAMECFRPVLLEPIALEDLTTTDQGRACFWLVKDPAGKISRSRRIDSTELGRLTSNQAVAVNKESPNDLVMRAVRNDFTTLENQVSELS